MATNLTNTVLMNGQYNNIAFAEQSASVTAQIVRMAIAKTASPMVWVGGELTYSISVTNNDDALPLANLVFTDTLDALTAFVPDSVLINNVAPPAADVTYVPATRLLTVNVPAIAIGATAVITFRVTQATQ